MLMNSYFILTLCLCCAFAANIKREPTYIGIVIDMTVSTQNSQAVTDWITECVFGNDDSCGISPSGGWTVTWFNDQNAGALVEPTLNTQLVIDSVRSMDTTTSNGCTRLAFEGISLAIRRIPAKNSGCKIYFFTDGKPADDNRLQEIEDKFAQKECSFIPILTSCCQFCQSPCVTVGDEYCQNHVSDKRPLEKVRNPDSNTEHTEVAYYSLAKSTGGNIYLVNPDKTALELPRIMRQNTTLGFCPTPVLAGPGSDGYLCENDCVANGQCWDRTLNKCFCNSETDCQNNVQEIPTCTMEKMKKKKCPTNLIAGPRPNGFRCREDCEKGGMCWDNSINKCLCTNLVCPHKHFQSICTSQSQEIICNPAVSLEVYPDSNNCERYFFCVFGRHYHHKCENGQVFSDESRTYCADRETVPSPCGTLGV